MKFSKILLIPIKLLLVFNLCPIVEASDDNKSFSNAPTECKKQKDKGAVLIGKLSDIKGGSSDSKQKLRIGPSPTSKKKINVKASKNFNTTIYQSVLGARVYVECYIPSSGFAFVRLVKPDYLTHHNGWIDSSILSASMKGSKVKTSQSKNNNWYEVTYDTRDTYTGQTVELIKKKAPFCGNASIRGEKGKGYLTFLKSSRGMSVIIEPCMPDKEEPAVKLPDGRVLYLRKSI